MFHPYNNAAKVYKLYFPQKNKRGRGLRKSTTSPIFQYFVLKHINIPLR